MAATDYKVYHGCLHLASTRYPTDAVKVATGYTGAVVKWSGRIVWKDGKDTRDLTRAGLVIEQTVNGIKQQAFQELQEADRRARLRREAAQEQLGKPVNALDPEEMP